MIQSLETGFREPELTSTQQKPLELEGQDFLFHAALALCKRYFFGNKPQDYGRPKQSQVHSSTSQERSWWMGELTNSKCNSNKSWQMMENEVKISIFPKRCIYNGS